MDGLRANIVPDQPWPSDGTAEVTPLPPFGDVLSRSLPLEHRIVGGDVVIRRSDYPLGVVIIPQGSGVSGPSATLPMLASQNDEIVLDYPGFQSTPDGVVFWFIS